MGGPKALLVVDGEPLVRRHVRRLCEVGCGSIIVVVRSAVAERVRAAVGDVFAVFIVAADTSSPAASLAMALGSLGTLASPTTDGDTPVIVTPVDMLPARRSTIDALLTGIISHGAHVATPRHRDRGGHPVVVREKLLRVFREGYRGTLRDIIRAEEPRRHRVDVDDASVAGDLDTPADLVALRPGLLPRFDAGSRTSSAVTRE